MSQEFVERWENGKLRLVPKNQSTAAQLPGTVESLSSNMAVADVCGAVQTTTGNVVGAPNIGVESRATMHPWIDAVYGAAKKARRLFEREDARQVRDLT
jgi:hypothetical protein